MLLERLRRGAREIFEVALASVDAGAAVRGAVSCAGGRLRVVESEFDLRAEPRDIYCVALGKAAAAMASALGEVLGDRLKGGVLSAPAAMAQTPRAADGAPASLSAAGASAASFPPRAGTLATLPPRWHVFAGGHPLPDEASLEAARAAFGLLRRADETRALVIFLVSGGGSAMLEWPRDARVTLADLHETNRVLVSCGARIAEVNAVRRALSAVKGGGLAAHAPRAAQVTLIVSDTNAGEAHNVASGPTLPPPGDAPGARSVVERYKLAGRLPASVLRAIGRPEARATRTGEELEGAREATRQGMPPREQSARAGEAGAFADGPPRRHYVLLDNEYALERAAEAARARGYLAEVARDVVEQPVEEGAAVLVSRLAELGRRGAAEGRAVCLISGGELACPVRGDGVGGRSAETALRCAIEFDARAAEFDARAMESEAGAAPGGNSAAVALCAGTDGVDGNSPAAGALADHTTVRRARAAGLDARRSLAASDAYTFFQTLGDALHTGPTGTNVRDLRILIKG